MRTAGSKRRRFRVAQDRNGGGHHTGPSAQSVCGAGHAELDRAADLPLDVRDSRLQTHFDPCLEQLVQAEVDELTVAAPNAKLTVVCRERLHVRGQALNTDFGERRGLETFHQLSNALVSLSVDALLRQKCRSVRIFLQGLCGVEQRGQRLPWIGQVTKLAAVLGHVAVGHRQELDSGFARERERRLRLAVHEFRAQFAR